MKFENGKCVCDVCGIAVRMLLFDDCGRVHHRCTKPQPNGLGGLGDRIERWLSSYGLTQEKYKEVKQKFHLPPTCDCDGRKEWFNKVGAYFGIDPDRYGPHKETK